MYQQNEMIEIQRTMERLKGHVHSLTVDIGERSVLSPRGLEQTEEYIASCYAEMGLSVQKESYTFRGLDVANLVTEISFSAAPATRYLLGAHYDSVAGTVGADDNASAVAVQIETARLLREMQEQEKLDVSVKFVSFVLEEPPAFGTRYMGSKVHARKAKEAKEKIDGMICLEMVGYTCHRPGCQKYPFPLRFFGYPREGNFIGVVSNRRSRNFAGSLFRAFRENPELPVVKLAVPFNGWLMPSVRLSDHAPFWDRGFKAVMITDSAFYRNPHYHLTSDIMETLDFRFMAELVESLLMFFRSHSPNR